MRGLNQAPIAYEDRMVLCIRRRREAVAMDRRAAEIVLECGLDMPSREELSFATAAGDPARLRGLPAIGPGVGGAIPGTNPLSALMAKESRRRR